MVGVDDVGLGGEGVLGGGAYWGIVIFGMSNFVSGLLLFLVVIVVHSNNKV